MRFFITLFLYLFIPQLVFSQSRLLKQVTRDSLAFRLKEDSMRIYRVTKVKPYLRLERRYSFIGRESAGFLGFLVGATFFEKHIACMGYYFLDRKSRKLVGDVTGSYELKNLAHFNFSYQYILFNTRYLQVNLPLEAGYGNYILNIGDSSGVKKEQGHFIPIAGSLQLILKPFRSIGISTIGGYRYVKQQVVKVDFNGWFYSVGLWVDARQLLRDWSYYRHKKRYSKALSAY